MEDGSPKLLVDLGIGIDSYFVDTHNQRLVALYDIGNVYLVDLMFVEALSEVLDEDSSAEDLLEEACTYLFPPGTFDEESLMIYLEGNEPQACP
jgi:hypothetical protein